MVSISRVVFVCRKLDWYLERVAGAVIARARKTL